MNAPTTFNTLAFVRRMESAGMDSRQAEALAEALGDVVFETTATKSDLRELELRLGADLKELDQRLTSQLKELELRVMGRLGAVIGGSTALTIAVLGALISLH